MPYRTTLTPATSSLRPHVPARDRLLRWRPVNSSRSLASLGIDIGLSTEDVQRVQEVAVFAWTATTAQVYGTGLLSFHVFCDEKHIAEEHRAPASNALIASFVANLAGSMSGSTIANYYHGIHAWHTLHGLPWAVDQTQMKAYLKAANDRSPQASVRKKRRPYTIQYMTALRGQLNIGIPLDAAVWACLTTGFFTVARLGELTVPNLAAFDPMEHVKRSNMHVTQDANGLETTAFFIPRTKCSIEGEEIAWAANSTVCNPAAAMANHVSINTLPSTAPLFAYRHGGPSSSSFRALTKKAFLDRIKSASKDAGLDPLQGHGIRIGGTLFYLLKGLPFDVVKTIGRWAGNSFTLYLRKHATILAPYLQEQPVLEGTFVRYTMPPVRR